jgi:hypothetical protein
MYRLPIRFCAACMMLALVSPMAATAAQNTPSAGPTGPANWGTYLKPFAADSLWNSRPVAPVLGEFVIPKSDYFPSIAEGAWSTGVFLSQRDDGPVTVVGLPGAKGLFDADAEAFRPSITIPRWPKDVVAASGLDGHADIADPITGIVHSFYQLRKVGDRWAAEQYAWTRIDGRGWGDPAHFYQGARATAVPSMAGLMRKHEIKDGDSMYRHALAMSLTFNGLSASPAYIFPATSADWDAAKTNSGAIPQGALLMLPETFNTQQIGNPDLRKVAETLKVYGAYVVDRNHGTPFAIYVENGSGFELHRGGWNNGAASDLETIRASLRQVVGTKGWIDGNGKAFSPQKNLNVLSMRGPWRLEAGASAGTFDSWAQAVVFPNTSTPIVQVNDTARGLQPVSWAVPKPGARYRLTAITTGGAKLQVFFTDKSSNQIVFDSGQLANGATSTFAWPTGTVGIVVRGISGVGQGSSVRGELVSVGR